MPAPVVVASIVSSVGALVGSGLSNRQRQRAQERARQEANKLTNLDQGPSLTAYLPYLFIGALVIKKIV